MRNKDLYSYFNQVLQLSDAVIVTDSDHQICFVNEQYERITGYKSAEVTGVKAGILRSKLTPKAIYDQMKRALAKGNAWSGVFTNRKKNGQLWNSSISITPYEVMGSIYYVGVFRELESLERGYYLDEQRVYHLQTSLLKVLAVSCEIRDPGIENHLINVQHLTQLLVEKYNERFDCSMNRQYMNQIVNGSILHDIGKSAIPEGILYKPGPLAPYERTIIEMHPQIGVDILDKIYGELDEELFQHEFLVAKNIILYHHERWDGNGYPLKHKGEQIPIEARIVSVVDVYDALVSKRPYKEKWNQQDAIHFIMEQKGKQFDPDVVDALVELYTEGILN